MSVEIAKVRLQKALERLEYVIDNKISVLEFENKSLRAELASLKNNTPPAPIRKKAPPKEEKNIEQEQPALLTPKVASDIDLTLSKLKKLVG